ncbi:metallophosphoesterase family protein [Patescibacteria group bacterium]
MKIAIISDIHSNLAALQAVERDIKSLKVNFVYCLGDIIGYGPLPKECLVSVTKLCKKILKGNHEDSVCNLELEKELSRYALEGVRFTREKLDEKTIKFLSKLPTKLIIKKVGMTLCHGSYTEPSTWKYVDSEDKAEKELKEIPTKICVIGHTHNPFVFGNKKGLFEYLPDDLILDSDQKYLVNVGSVGQPRDGDCRASYGVFEFKNNQVIFNLRRIFYNISQTEQAFQQTNLSLFLSERLFRGE